MIEAVPGQAVERLARLIGRVTSECALNLSGVQVLTEAATGPYVVTPVIAALAGAEVVALTAASRHGSVAHVTHQTMTLADRVGVADRITVTTERDPRHFAAANVITNSGHVRPITGALADAIRPGSALPLMFEAWEIRVGRVDIDLDRLLRRGVRIAGTNERHPDVDVFSYLGTMALAQLSDARVPAYRADIAVACDNAFLDYIVRDLVAVGARVRTAVSVSELLDAPWQDPSTPWSSR